MVFLGEASWPATASNSKPVTAIFLNARDDLPDSIFAGSLVLAINNLGPAPIGIVINRPTSIPVSQIFPHLKRLAKIDDKIYFGGPVEFASVWFLVRAATQPKHSMHVFDDVYLSADRRLLLQLLERDKPMNGLRIFVGHAGWAPGQLEAEIDRHDWTLKRADAESIFSGKFDRPFPPMQGQSI